MRLLSHIGITGLLLFVWGCGGEAPITDREDLPAATDRFGNKIVVDDMPSPSRPAGYPEGRVEDPFAEEAVDLDYEARRQAYFDMHAASRGGNLYAELMRAAVGAPVHEGAIYDKLKYINERHDCADFQLHGALRLLYHFSDNPSLSDDLKARTLQTVLDFKYWPDEPGTDSMCSWSENHYILFSAGGYLAGQRYPDEVFTNSGRTGREMMEIFRPRVMKWLELRWRSGFSEWLSNVYYDEDLAALLNLADFAEDKEIATRAAMVTDILFLDMAVHTFKGVFGPTHGRTYEGQKKWAHREATSSAAKLAFGVGQFDIGQMSACCLALSETYRVPPVLEAIVRNPAPISVNRQRTGITIDNAAHWELGFDNAEDGMQWLTIEAYSHPAIANLFVDMLDEFNWWGNAFFEPFAHRQGLITKAHAVGVLPWVCRWFEKDVTRNLRTEVNIYTYRTPDYMLSTAQDWRAGYGGDQQHIWQATLGPDAVCFTTSPVEGGHKSPSYWTGSGSLPRAAQVENVAIILYDVSLDEGLYVTNKSAFTHAWLPQDKFDHVFDLGNWMFARKGTAYLGLYSQHPFRWQDEEGEDQNRELIVDGTRNVYICELGREETDGSFTDFAGGLADTPISIDGFDVVYESPSQGTLEMGWTGPLTQNGEPIILHDYPRYDTPYGRVEFDPETIEIQHDGQRLSLNWKKVQRIITGLPK